MKCVSGYAIDDRALKLEVIVAAGVATEPDEG